MHKHLIKELIVAAIFTILATAFLYFIYPSALYRITYDVHESDLYEQSQASVSPGAVLRETFCPRSSYVRSIGIHVDYKNSTDTLTGILYDSSGKRIARATLHKMTFRFDKRLDTTKHYTLEIIASPQNQEDILLTFGPSGIGPSEHISFEGSKDARIPYTEYVYGTYSKKLLSAWLVCFFTIGLCLREVLLNKSSH